MSEYVSPFGDFLIRKSLVKNVAVRECKKATRAKSAVELYTSWEKIEFSCLHRNGARSDLHQEELVGGVVS